MATRQISDKDGGLTIKKCKDQGHTRTQQKHLRERNKLSPEQREERKKKKKLNSPKKNAA